jgi:hypothetical protein
MGVIPFFNDNPAVSTVFITIVVIIISWVAIAVITVALTIIMVAIAICRITGAKEGEETQADVEIAMVVTTVRLCGRGHGKSANPESCSDNQ